MTDGLTLTPAQIVAELDLYIVGQERAKRAVAIALRNRWRRQNVPPELRDEVAPKNIIMIGPTGVGKTEVARRLAKLAQAPFLKVEASKYTEVGYVGRDVESMIRDLTELSVNMVKAEMTARVQERAEQLAEERLLDLLLPRSMQEPFSSSSLEEVTPDASRETTKDKLRAQLRAGRLDDRLVELEVQHPSLEIVGANVVFETHPHGTCPSITAHYGRLVGLSIARGFTHKVRELFGGPRGCTHTTALLQAMAPVAVQSIWSMRVAPTSGVRVMRPRDPDERRKMMAFNLNTCHVWSEDGERMQAIDRGEEPEMPLWMTARMARLGVAPEEMEARWRG